MGLLIEKRKESLKPDSTDDEDADGDPDADLRAYNKNNVEINYSCMCNIKSVIQNYNPNLLSKHTTPAEVCSCSYHRKSGCLLDNKCLSESFILKAAASQIPSQVIKFDYWTCARTFKEQYNNHTTTFNTRKKSTKL